MTGMRKYLMIISYRIVGSKNESWPNIEYCHQSRPRPRFYTGTMIINQCNPPNLSLLHTHLLTWKLVDCLSIQERVRESKREHILARLSPGRARMQLKVLSKGEMTNLIKTFKCKILWPEMRYQYLCHSSRPISRSCDFSGLISGQVMWSLSTNERLLTASHDHTRPIRGQYLHHVTSLDQ